MAQPCWLWDASEKPRSREAAALAEKGVWHGVPTDATVRCVCLISFAILCSFLMQTKMEQTSAQILLHQADERSDGGPAARAAGHITGERCSSKGPARKVLVSLFSIPIPLA